MFRDASLRTIVQFDRALLAMGRETGLDRFSAGAAVTYAGGENNCTAVRINSGSVLAPSFCLSWELRFTTVL